MDNLQTSTAVVPLRATHTKTRYYISAMIFLVTALNYGDRATISMVATPMSQEQFKFCDYGLYLFCIRRAYVIGQIPGGWLLDKFGARRVYFWSIMPGQIFTVMLGFVDIWGSILFNHRPLFILCRGFIRKPCFPR